MTLMGSKKSSDAATAASSDSTQMDIRAEVDDERRDVPPGWTRAFDRQTGRHFYSTFDTLDMGVNAQSTWIHPYDNPTFVNTLPLDHPAHPTSPAAQAYNHRSTQEQAAHVAEGVGKKKGWLSRTIGNLKGEGPSFDEKVHQKHAEEMFVKRREALKEGDTSAHGTEEKYAKDPFAFSAPIKPFDRFAETEIKYAYGYQGSYQRKYTVALGYGTAEPVGAGMSTATDWFLHGAVDTPIAGRTKVANYGF